MIDQLGIINVISAKSEPDIIQIRDLRASFQFELMAPPKTPQYLPSLERLSESLPQLQGTLEKKSQHWFMSNQIVHCTLKDRVFRYFRNSVLQGVLNFDQQQFDFSEIWDEDGNPVSFKPIGSVKIFHFQTNKIDCKLWCQTIKIHINGSQGQINYLTHNTKLDRFWKFDLIPVSWIFESAEDLDLVLFKGSAINNQLQRAVTFSDYDHIALIVVHPDNGPYLFESLPNQGVGLINWADFLHKKYYQLYEKIAIRKLKINRTPELIATYHKFVNFNLEKRHGFNLGKLFTFTSQDQFDLQINERTYFASELVAKCYKQLKILPGAKSSTQYWPRTFAQNITLQNATLETEKILNLTPL